VDDVTKEVEDGEEVPKREVKEEITMEEFQREYKKLKRL
jgi:hypothetical protein